MPPQQTRRRRVTAVLKIELTAGKATPPPPVGTALGPHAVNIMDFCKQYNAATQAQAGNVVPVEITIYEDRSFSFVLKTPPAAVLLRKAAKVDRARLYRPAEALALAKETNPTKFDATVEVAFRLGVDPRRADQMVRGTVSLPNGTGKTIRVAVFAEDDAARQAEEAGADVVGSRDLVERVQGGFLDFDAAVAVPEMIGQAGRLRRIPRPRGLMANPRAGTVTPDVAKAVADIKAE